MTSNGKDWRNLTSLVSAIDEEAPEIDALAQEGELS